MACLEMLQKRRHFNGMISEDFGTWAEPLAGWSDGGLTLLRCGRGAVDQMSPGDPHLVGSASISSVQR